MVSGPFVMIEARWLLQCTIAFFSGARALGAVSPYHAPQPIICAVLPSLRHCQAPARPACGARVTHSRANYLPGPINTSTVISACDTSPQTCIKAHDGEPQQGGDLHRHLQMLWVSAIKHTNCQPQMLLPH